MLGSSLEMEIFLGVKIIMNIRILTVFIISESRLLLLSMFCMLVAVTNASYER